MSKKTATPVIFLTMAKGGMYYISTINGSKRSLVPTKNQISSKNLTGYGFQKERELKYFHDATKTEKSLEEMKKEKFEEHIGAIKKDAEGMEVNYVLIKITTEERGSNLFIKTIEKYFV